MHWTQNWKGRVTSRRGGNRCEKKSHPLLFRSLYHKWFCRHLLIIVNSLWNRKRFILYKKRQTDKLAFSRLFLRVVYVSYVMSFIPFHSSNSFLTEQDAALPIAFILNRWFNSPVKHESTRSSVRHFLTYSSMNFIRNINYIFLRHESVLRHFESLE